MKLLYTCKNCGKTFQSILSINECQFCKSKNIKITEKKSFKDNIQQKIINKMENEK